MTLKSILLSIMLIVPLTLSSCTLWDIIKPAGNGISVDTEIVAGDKSEEIASGAVVGSKEETHNTADAITQTYNTVNEQYPWWVLALLILGWILPSPSHMWKNLVGLIRRKRNA